MISVKQLIKFSLYNLLVVSFIFCLNSCSKTAYKPKVYDCFLFFNELELLDIRLQEMNEHVDKFVIVEACETFRGKPKPLYFSENKELFKKFSDKIIHIQLNQPFETDNPWIRERHQRAQILQGIKNCHQKDIILLSDLDEIVKGDKIPEIINLLSSKKAEAVVCQQKMYYGFLNRFQSSWQGTVATTFKNFCKIPTKTLRRIRNMRPRTLKKAHISSIYLMKDAGWHFTSLGGVERVIQKIEAYSHFKSDNPEFKEKQRLTKALNTYPLVDIDETFPLFIREQKDYFEKIGFIAKTEG